MRLRAAVSLAVLAILVVTVTWAIAQGGAPQGQRPAFDPKMAASFMYLERSWTAVSFQLNCTAQQLASLKPTYANALTARDAAVKQAITAKNWQAGGKASLDCMTRLQTKLKQVLSSQQWTKLDQLMRPPAPPRQAPSAASSGPR